MLHRVLQTSHQSYVLSGLKTASLPEERRAVWSATDAVA
jgi:hypothetical protein